MLGALQCDSVSVAIMASFPSVNKSIVFMKAVSSIPVASPHIHIITFYDTVIFGFCHRLLNLTVLVHNYQLKNNMNCCVIIGYRVTFVIPRDGVIRSGQHCIYYSYSLLTRPHVRPCRGSDPCSEYEYSFSGLLGIQNEWHCRYLLDYS